MLYESQFYFVADIYVKIEFVDYIINNVYKLIKKLIKAIINISYVIDINYIEIL